MLSAHRRERRASEAHLAERPPGEQTPDVGGLTRRALAASTRTTERHSPKQEPNFREFLKRMKGLEPSTFCMANASVRSRPFAPVRSNPLFAELLVKSSERKRTRANAEPCHSCHSIWRRTRTPRPSPQPAHAPTPVTSRGKVSITAETGRGDGVESLPEHDSFGVRPGSRAWPSRSRASAHADGW